MSENINVSFIPKKSLSKRGSFRRRPAFGIAFLVTVMIALGSVAFAVNEYYSVRSLISKRDVEVKKLGKYIKELEQSSMSKDIEFAERFKRQITIAEMLLNQHISPSNVFEIIESTTPKQVSYNSYSYSGSEDVISISMSGTADSHAVLAATSLMYRKEPKFLEVELSGIDFSEEDEVSFSFAGKLDPAVIRFVTRDKDDQNTSERSVDEYNDELDDNI